jgi:hypothetical protein
MLEVLAGGDTEVAMTVLDHTVADSVRLEDLWRDPCLCAGIPRAPEHAVRRTR